MSDITKRGWKCDLCGKEIWEGDCGYKAKFSLKLASDHPLNAYLNLNLKEICGRCADGICQMWQETQ